LFNKRKSDTGPRYLEDLINRCDYQENKINEVNFILFNSFLRKMIAIPREKKLKRIIHEKKSQTLLEICEMMFK
jgi:predicted GIY-YIG superfamily endonuclease